jgi:hypothetical protein
MSCSLVEIHRSFGETYCLHLQGRTAELLATFLFLVGSFAWSLTLILEARCSYETSKDFYRTTRRHIPEDITLRLKLISRYTTMSQWIQMQLWFIRRLFNDAILITPVILLRKRRDDYRNWRTYKDFGADGCGLFENIHSIRIKVRREPQNNLWGRAVYR